MALLQVALLRRIASGKSKCNYCGNLVFDLKARGHCKHILGLMVSKPDFQFRSPRSSSGKGEENLLFVWCGGPSVKKQWRETGGLTLFFL